MNLQLLASRAINHAPPISVVTLSAGPCSMLECPSSHKGKISTTDNVGLCIHKRESGLIVSLRCPPFKVGLATHYVQTKVTYDA